MKVTIDIELGEIDYEIEANIDHDPGCHTLSNGDPGWPPTTDIEILSISSDTEVLSPRDRDLLYSENESLIDEKLLEEFEKSRFDDDF